MANDERLQTIRHSMAHVMAEAVLELFPGTKIAIGPAIENGFYYDFDLPRPLQDSDLEEITEHMRKIIESGVPFERREVTREEARKLFADQQYKLELLDAIPEGEAVSLYTQGNFTDLCRGPHVESTKELNKDAFKLLSIAGAYWRGKETNPMLTRIYGTAFPKKELLNEYLARVELGKALTLSAKGGTEEGRSAERFYRYTRCNRRAWCKLWVLNRIPMPLRAWVFRQYNRLAWKWAKKGL